MEDYEVEIDGFVTDEDEDDPFDFAPPTFTVIVAAVRCGRRLVRQFDAELSGQGLTFGQFHALLEIQRAEGWIHPGAIGRRMGISRQAAHSLVRQIDRHGILRWRDDGWIKSVQLLPEGDDVLARARWRLEETMDAVERVSIRERRMIVKAQESVVRELARSTRRTGIWGEPLPKPNPFQARW